MRNCGILTAVLLVAACGQSNDGLPQLDPSATNEQIMAHMLEAQESQVQTSSLAEHFPELPRKRAYAIQRLRLEAGQSAQEHVGWKLGWTRLAAPDDVLDPIVGHYFEDRVFAEGTPVSTRYFTDSVANAEPEIVFYLKKDLPGPAVTREEVLEAIDSVGIAMEFVNWRAAEPRTREHAIADNGIASGVVLGGERYPLSDIDFSDMSGEVTVNETETSTGPTTSIMGEDPLAALVWAANELPKWGMQLRAGDFVLSGTVCVPLPVTTGDTATVSFTDLGTVTATFVD